MTNDKAAMIRK